MATTQKPDAANTLRRRPRKSVAIDSMLRDRIDEWKAAMLDRRAKMAAWRPISATEREAFDAARDAHAAAAQREQLAAHDLAVTLVIEIGEWLPLRDAMAPFDPPARVS